MAKEAKFIPVSKRKAGSNKGRFADPGYQDDGKPRYDLSDEKKAKAAWSYINQAGNASKYTPEQLRRIKSRIKAALRKFGVSVGDDKKESTEELLRAIESTWTK